MAFPIKWFANYTHTTTACWMSNLKKNEKQQTLNRRKNEFVAKCPIIEKEKRPHHTKGSYGRFMISTGVSINQIQTRISTLNPCGTITSASAWLCIVICCLPRMKNAYLSSNIAVFIRHVSIWNPVLGIKCWPATRCIKRILPVGILSLNEGADAATPCTDVPFSHTHGLSRSAAKENRTASEGQVACWSLQCKICAVGWAVRQLTHNSLLAQCFPTHFLCGSDVPATWRQCFVQNGHK